MKLKRWGAEVYMQKGDGPRTTPRGLYRLDDTDWSWRFFFRRTAERAVADANDFEESLKDLRIDGWRLVYEVRDRRTK